MQIDIFFDGHKFMIWPKLPNFQPARSLLYRARRKQLPHMPQSCTEVHFENEWAWSTDGKQFALVEDGDDNKSPHATDENLKLLANAETVFVHRTFHTCPEIFFRSSLFMPQEWPAVFACVLPSTWQDSQFLPADLYLPKGEGKGTIVSAHTNL